MFSQTTEYALRAMIALTAGSGSPTTTRAIAVAMKVPASYLSKVLQALVRAKLVRSTRGVKGGFVLARPAAGITLLDVVNAVNPLERITSCPLDLTNHSSELCPLHRRLDESLAQAETALRNTTLAELISEENPCPTLRTQLQQLQTLR
ncbi:transcriptional regulator [bacterium CG_4_9_14_3_um_filter_65_15]|nr:MAG: transcriptional regulator [bacterium CG_4_9_14_3_um_filter_65_15]